MKYLLNKIRTENIALLLEQVSLILDILLQGLIVFGVRNNGAEFLLRFAIYYISPPHYVLQYNTVRFTFFVQSGIIALRWFVCAKACRFRTTESSRIFPNFPRKHDTSHTKIPIGVGTLRRKSIKINA